MSKAIEEKSKNMKVVEMRKGLEYCPGTACPYCNSSNTTKMQSRFEIMAPMTDDRGYSITQEVCHERQIYKCEECLNEYIVDLGKHAYSIYETPHSENNIGDIKCLAKFESDYYQNFSIIMAKSTSKRPKYYYFIDFEDDYYPIFITFKQMKEFLKSSEKAYEYAFNHCMTRYR